MSKSENFFSIIKNMRIFFIWNSENLDKNVFPGKFQNWQFSYWFFAYFGIFFLRLKTFFFSLPFQKTIFGMAGWKGKIGQASEHLFVFGAEKKRLHLPFMVQIKILCYLWERCWLTNAKYFQWNCCAKK